MLERTFADALGASVGDRVSVNGKSLRVAGIAVTAAEAPYPNLCYLTTSSCSSLLTNGNSRNIGRELDDDVGRDRADVEGEPAGRYVLNLKLASPGDAQAFVGSILQPAT